MRFFEMAFVFAVVGFVTANALLSLFTALVWRGVRRYTISADALFFLRMFPALGSAAFVLGVILPAYWFFEPRGTSERAGPALGMVAVIAFTLLAAGLRRLLSSLRETHRLERAWKAAAVETVDAGLRVPVYRVRSSLPIAALAGSFRPRLFVSDRLLNALLPGERRAVMDHEAAHVRALDNLKRTAIKLAPDVLSFLPAGREIEAAWTIAAEEDADDRAAGPDGARSLDLASALIKASRLSPSHCPDVSNFCDESTIVRRVARLLEDRPRREASRARRAVRVAIVIVTLFGLSLSAESGLRAAYTLTEATVRFLHYGPW